MKTQTNKPPTENYLYDVLVYDLALINFLDERLETIDFGTSRAFEKFKEIIREKEKVANKEMEKVTGWMTKNKGKMSNDELYKGFGDSGPWALMSAYWSALQDFSDRLLRDTRYEQK